MRIGLGPVFACETSIASRRWQAYGARSFLVFALLVAMATVAASPSEIVGGSFAQNYAALGQDYFYAIIGVELALVLFTAPAATAGAICLDRTRGTLAHVLVTDLSDAEIILGKLAARLVPILALIACTWPVMAISSLLGGIDPIALTLAFAIIIAVAVLGCSLALMLSVWARRTHEVLLAVYLIWALVLLAWPIWYVLSLGGLFPGPDHWLLVANPFYLAFAPYRAPNSIGIEDYLGFFAATVAASVTSILISVWRVRPVACHSDGKARRHARFGWLGRLSRALPGPSLDGNPVLWREWHRLRPSAWMIAVSLLIWTTTTVVCLIGACWVWWAPFIWGGGPRRAVMPAVAAYVILILFGLLMLSAVAPTSMSEERQRGSLDVLVATPLSTTAILLGKWWGTFRLVPLLAIGPGLFALALATARVGVSPTGSRLASAENLSVWPRLAAVALLVATILTYGAAFNSVGLAVATWIKRQGRGIATSVSIFVLLAAGWPVLVISGPVQNAAGLAALSPIFSAGALGEDLAMRSDHLGWTLWWVGLWDAAAAAIAVGVCWLAVRTFDGAFGRIPERPRTSHWMADVVIVVAGVTAAACLVRAVASWVQGVHPHEFPDVEDHPTFFAFILIELTSLILVSLLAALAAPHVGPGGNRLAPCGAGVSPAGSPCGAGVSPAGSPCGAGVSPAGSPCGAGVSPAGSPCGAGVSPAGSPCGAGVSPAGHSNAGGTPAPRLRDLFWRVFRLALLLAIAPCLIVLALATARDFWPEVTLEDTSFGAPPGKAVMITYTTPTGETSRRIYLGDRNDPTVQMAAKDLRMQGPVLPLASRLRDAGLLMLTFLAHAAGATIAGLGLAIGIKRKRPRIVVAVAAPLLVAVAWPVCVFFVIGNHGAAQRLYALSPIWVADRLLEPLIGRQPHATDLLGWIAACDVGVILGAAGALYLASRFATNREVGMGSRIAESLAWEMPFSR